MRVTIIFVITLLATAAYAHEGVKNPSVMARMQSMKTIAADTKTLVQMSRGQITFDRAAMQVAASRIAAEAEATPGLYADKADDPKSEALPAIWENWDDFKKISADLARTAEAFQSITAQPDMAAAVAAMGATCSACHKAYRE